MTEFERLWAAVPDKDKAHARSLKDSKPPAKLKHPATVAGLRGLLCSSVGLSSHTPYPVSPRGGLRLWGFCSQWLRSFALLRLSLTCAEMM